MTKRNLLFKAGPGAQEIIRREGFAPERIGTIAGASGGAKWLVLSQLDRAILAHVLPKLRQPVHTISTSIGAWRFACYAQDDPLAAIDRFEEAYIEQSYSDQPDRREITAKSREILELALGEHGVAQILRHPVLRTHIMTVRARNLAASDNRLLLTAGLIAAASCNALSRRALALFFERALFFDPRTVPPFYELDQFAMQRVELASNNLADAIAATGSIPLVLSGVRNIRGAAPGVYRDGGIVDYHLDLPHSSAGRITLYPHFLDRIVPGWFDKKLAWRRPAAEHVDRTLLVCPSAEFVASLPHGKIPDRTDFRNFPPRERIRNWRIVVAACQALAEEFVETLETGDLESRLLPL